MPHLPDTPPRLPGTEGLPLSGLTLLAVEDSRFTSEALRLLCRHSGARLRRADCLDVARRHLALYRPDAAIVDLGLPDGPGEALIAELARARQRHPRPALIAISGDAALGPSALAAGADVFLEKPLPGIAVFQATVLRLLPVGPARHGDLVSPATLPPPDPMALRDDLLSAADLLEGPVDAATRCYLARFLGGIARSAGDTVLAEAARALRDAGPGAPDDAGRPRPAATRVALARAAALVRGRLAEGRSDPLCVRPVLAAAR